MTTLAQNEVRAYEASQVDCYNDLPVIASDIIFEGSAVGDNGSGFNRPLVSADPFRGFSTRKVDNTDGSDGDENVHVIEKGYIQLSVTGVVDEDDVGETVYATDDNLFTLTSSGTSDIGKIVRHVSGAICIVYFESESVRSI